MVRACGFTASVLLLACSAEEFAATPTSDGGAADAAADAAPNVDDGGSSGDAALEAAPSDGGACNPQAPFGAPELVPGVAGVVGSMYLDGTGSTLYVGISGDLFEQQLANGGFGAPAPLSTIIAVSANDVHASLSADRKLIAFGSDRSTTSKIWIASRSSPSVAFDPPTAGGPMAAVNANAPAILDPYLSPDGTTLYFTAFDPEAGQYMLSLASRGDTSQAFGGIKSFLTDARSAVLSADGLTLYYANVTSRERIFVTKRAQLGAPFSAGALVAELDTSEAAVLNQMPSAVSADGCTLYFVSTRGGKAYGAYRATRGK